MSDCRHSGVGVHDCAERHEEAGVICDSKCFCQVYSITSFSLIVTLEKPCNKTDVRLVDGDTLADGRVEICLNGVWGSVCGVQWDDRDARVVCRQLGYDGCKLNWPQSSVI